jgi:hypothetical protein
MAQATSARTVWLLRVGEKKCRPPVPGRLGIWGKRRGAPRRVRATHCCGCYHRISVGDAYLDHEIDEYQSGFFCLSCIDCEEWQ